MNANLSNYVKGCVMCEKQKKSNINLGLYTPLPLPSRPWKSVSMDIIGGLPMSRKGHDYLYVIVHRFREMCILRLCNKKATTKVTTYLFFQHVWVNFGLPNSIISDQDSLFLRKLWSSLWEIMDTKLNKSTTLYPQTNKQTEVVNRTVVHLL